MIRLPPLALALTATTTLAAADFTGGLQVGGGFPQSDLKTVTNTSSSGYGFVFGRCDLGNGHTLRAKLDFASVSGSHSESETIQGSTVNVNLQVKATMAGLVVDYLYYFKGTSAQGPYAGAGLGSPPTKSS
jgi:hypothetical protein